MQLARAAGVEVIAITGQKDKPQFLRKLGADVVFDHKMAKFRMWAMFSRSIPIAAGIISERRLTVFFHA
ncbi:hypothetical protein AURDEDRAFT_163549 [Auricularia subglabra TFB-10046 SS5]|nr:hypothetical protein AURDEDRAFT_163549 [Auricularia subglabra TFB-10046 SS5]